MAGSPGAALREAARSFGRLPGAAKAALAVLGLLLVPAILALSVLLSPVLAVAAALVFGASLIGLIVRAGQRWAGMPAPLWGWGITAAGSLVLALVFAGISGAIYGDRTGAGADAGGGAGPAGEVQYDVADVDSSFGGEAAEDCLDEVGPASPPSYYEVVDSETYEDGSGTTGIALVVAMEIHGNPWASVGELQAEIADYDAVEVVAYAPNLASYDPVSGEVVPGPLAPPTYEGLRWHIANSSAGEALLNFPEEDLNDCGTSYGSGAYRWGHLDRFQERG